MMFESSSNTPEKLVWTTDDLVVHCNYLKQHDENDFEVVMVVLRGGTHIDNYEE